MSYPPSPSRSHSHAEAYELSPYPHAGPSTPSHHRRHSGGPSQPGSHARSRPLRTLTLANNDTSANIIFTAPVSASTAATPRRPSLGRRRTISLQGSPGSPHRGPWANFLNEDSNGVEGSHRRDEAASGRVEEVHVPDFGQMLGFNPEEEDHYEVARGIKADWRKRLYLLMEEPRSGREAFFVHIFVTGAILFSVVLTTLSTLPTFHMHPTSIQALFGLDTTLVVLFTIEYLARCLAHANSPKSFWKWFTSFFPLLDLLAILPYYIEVAREEDTSILFRFTILRTFRLLRVFRAFRYQNSMLLTIEVMYVAVQRSKDALGAISFFILLVLVLFSTLIYFAERGTWDANVGAFLDADGDPSLFDSIPQTAWFALVTMSTVGYGEVVPRSFLGKLLTMPLLLFGLLLIALPSFVLGRNFAIVFDAMTAQTAQKLTTPHLRHSFDSHPPSPMPPLPPSLTTTTPTPHPATAFTARSHEGSEAEADNQPLLPSHHSAETISGLPPYDSRPGPSRTGPSSGLGAAPLGGGASSTGSVNSRSVSAQGQRAPGAGLGVKMFDPAEDGLFTTGPAPPMRMSQDDGRRDREREMGEGVRGEGRDLTNTKLARNQIVLLEEIGSLRRVIDRQGEMLVRLMGLIEAQHPQVSVDGVSTLEYEATPAVLSGTGKTADLGKVPATDTVKGLGLVHPREKEEEQFSLGDSDDEKGGAEGS